MDDLNEDKKASDTKCVPIAHILCTYFAHKFVIKRKLKFKNCKNYLEATLLVNKINHL